MALPIILQNLLSTVIASLDTFMLGFIGQTELAAVALANQLFFCLESVFSGAYSKYGHNDGTVSWQKGLGQGKSDIHAVVQNIDSSLFLFQYNCDIFSGNSHVADDK